MTPERRKQIIWTVRCTVNEWITCGEHEELTLTEMIEEAVSCELYGWDKSLEDDPVAMEIVTFIRSNWY